MPTEELTPREVRQIAHDVNKIKETLYGNGRAGMDESLREMKTSIEKLSSEFHEYKTSQERKEFQSMKDRGTRDDRIEVAKEDNKRWIIRFAIATAVPYVISFIIWLVYWLVQLQPLLEKLQQEVK